MKNSTFGDNDKLTIKLHKTPLEEYFVFELRDLLGAEHRMLDALATWKNVAGSRELISALDEHIAHTELHINRLQIVFDMMGEAAWPKKCEVIEGLVRETEILLAETSSESATRDVALVMAVQKAEHYEIATYGGLITLARTIGQDDVAEILKHTMSEEKEMDELLSGLAENNINEEASTEFADM